MRSAEKQKREETKCKKMRAASNTHQPNISREMVKSSFHSEIACLSMWYRESLAPTPTDL